MQKETKIDFYFHDNSAQRKAKSYYIIRAFSQSVRVNRPSKEKSGIFKRQSAFV